VLPWLRAAGASSAPFTAGGSGLTGRTPTARGVHSLAAARAGPAPRPPAGPATPAPARVPAPRPGAARGGAPAPPARARGPRPAARRRTPHPRRPFRAPWGWTGEVSVRPCSGSRRNGPSPRGGSARRAGRIRSSPGGKRRVGQNPRLRAGHPDPGPPPARAAGSRNRTGQWTRSAKSATFCLVRHRRPAGTGRVGGFRGLASPGRAPRDPGPSEDQRETTMTETVTGSGSGGVVAGSEGAPVDTREERAP